MALLPMVHISRAGWCTTVGVEPAEAVQAHLKSHSCRPGVCTGTFPLTAEGIDEPERALHEACRAAGVPAALEALRVQAARSGSRRPQSRESAAGQLNAAGGQRQRRSRARRIRQGEGFRDQRMTALSICSGSLGIQHRAGRRPGMGGNGRAGTMRTWRSPAGGSRVRTGPRRRSRWCAPRLPPAAFKRTWFNGLARTSGRGRDAHRPGPRWNWIALTGHRRALSSTTDGNLGAGNAAATNEAGTLAGIDPRCRRREAIRRSRSRPLPERDLPMIARRPQFRSQKHAGNPWRLGFADACRRRVVEDLAEDARKSTIPKSTSARRSVYSRDG